MATLRLLELCRQHGENQTPEQWQTFATKFYATNGSLKYTLINSRKDQTKEFEINPAGIGKLYNTSTGIKETRMTLDRAVTPISRTPLVVECTKMSLFYDCSNGCKVVMSGSLNVEFTADYKILKFNFTVSDLVELIPRPKGDSLNSPSLDIKPDHKKKPGAKRSNSTTKTPSIEYLESSLTEFGVTSAALVQLNWLPVTNSLLISVTSDTIQLHPQSTQDSQPAVKVEANSALYQSPLPSAVMPPPNQPPNAAAYGGIMLNDMSHLHAGLITSAGGMKRRFPAVVAAGSGGTIAPSSTQSLPLENPSTMAGVSSNTLMTYTPVGGLNSHSNLSQPTGNYLASGIVGSPMPLLSPSIAPSVITTAAASMSLTPVTPAKGSKKARNSSVTSTTGNSTKGSAAGGTSTTNTGRIRKNIGKKEGSSRRKGSMAEEVEPVLSAAPPIIATTPSSTANAESPNTVSLAAAIKNRTAVTTGSPVSIPSPAVTPLMSTAVRSNQGEIDAPDLVSIPSDYDSISESNKGPDIWCTYIDDEQLLDYDGQEENSITGPMSNSSIVSTMSVNNATG
ncbi:hypothetical protein BGX27_003089 [Mortierella sp. AM989]|nr:hypothetical protein BGX27_003089 [Mortierella sp. AM989]